MKKKFLKTLSALTFAVLVFMQPASANAPADELTSSVREIFEPTFKNEEVSVDLTFTEYNIVDNHIADLGIAYVLKSPAMELDVDLITGHSELGKKVEKETKLSAHGKIKITDSKLLQDHPFKPVPKKEFETIVNQVSADKNLAQGLTIDLKPIKVNSKEEVEAFEVIVKPIEGNKDVQFSAKINVAISTDHLNFDLIVFDDGTAKSLFPEKDEVEFIQFLENVRKKDPATVMVMQSMGHIFKGYLGMLTAFPLMLERQLSQSQ